MKLLRCNRCKAEVAMPEPLSNNSPMALMGKTMEILSKTRGWAHLRVERRGALISPPVEILDLCEDCVEVLVEQFMVGAEVAPITTPQDQTPLPHAPMLDCQLIWNPGTGSLICRHDDPELFDSLVVDQDRTVSDLQETIRETSEDMATAVVAHAVPQRCGRKCSEAHTYKAGCLLVLGDGCSIPPQRQSDDLDVEGE
jgi:hypothetical protein